MRGFRCVPEPLCTSTWGPKPPYVAQLGPCVPLLGLSRQIFGPTRRPRGLPGRFWSDFGPLWEALEAQEHYKIQGFCCVSRSATDIVQIVQIRSLEGSKRPPRGAQERPGTPQERPRRPQDSSKSARSVPRAPPEPPKDGFRAALAAKLGPSGTKEPSGGLRRPFWTLRGRFSYSFLFAESIAKAVLWAKFAQAYAQHRCTSLCNFYMCISTATDSRSRSTNHSKSR